MSTAMLQAQANFNWLQPFQDLFAGFINFIPQLIGFLLILLVGRCVAGILRKLVTRGLQAIRFDGMMDRAGFKAPLARAGVDDPGKFFAMLVYYVVLLLA